MLRSLGLVAVLLASSADWMQAEEAPTKLDLADCPEPVQKTIQRELHDLEIPQVQRIEGEEGSVYRVVYKMDDMWYETKIREDGLLASKLLEKKLRNRETGFKTETYWAEVTLDDHLYHLRISRDGKLLSKRLYEKPEEEEEKQDVAPEAAPLALPKLPPREIRSVLDRERHGGELTGVPMLAKDNPRVTTTTYSFKWSSSTKEGTKIEFKIDKKPAVK
ncbi:hypothetical protein [Blastopirellula marina]|uniref:PepSY domain-containing protein n=1 Tax=Blastopirellula marina TaxID=124 RepID=A0A2S8GLB3_9BACT|nr:hypothetical protein [Blastopirellula marina]PQO45222.1 hypothetical protein C5Y93_14765 [Blastopirellula marina]